MRNKYLKPYKTKGKSYWWLVEVHYIGGKLKWKKLRYWGINKPRAEYTKIIMPLDDGGPLDNLKIIWQTGDGKWHCKKVPKDYVLCQKRGYEELFWKIFFKDISGLIESEEGGIWITKALKRSEAMKNVKNGKAVDLIPESVLQRLK